MPKGAEHKLTTTLVIAVLNSGGLARAEAMFAQMTGLRVGLRGARGESGGEGLITAARAIHMSREDFSTIYLLWRKLKSRDGFVSTSDHGKALDFSTARRKTGSCRSSPLAQGSRKAVRDGLSRPVSPPASAPAAPHPTHPGSMETSGHPMIWRRSFSELV